MFPRQTAATKRMTMMMPNQLSGAGLPSARTCGASWVPLCGRLTLTEKRPVMMLRRRTVTPIRYSLIKLTSVSRLAYWSEKRRIER